MTQKPQVRSVNNTASYTRGSRIILFIQGPQQIGKLIGAL